jgi:hypothetical protein
MTNLYVEDITKLEAKNKIILLLNDNANHVLQKNVRAKGGT